LGGAGSFFVKPVAINAKSTMRDKVYLIFIFKYFFKIVRWMNLALFFSIRQPGKRFLVFERKQYNPT
jgi:hypothetical protein